MKENQSKIYNAQMRSIHSEYWGKKKNSYLYKKNEIIDQIRKIFKL